jgi:hypothetical protein
MEDGTIESRQAVATKAKKLKKKGKTRAGQSSSIIAEEIEMNKGVTTGIREVELSPCVSKIQTAISIPETERRGDTGNTSSKGNEENTSEDDSVEMDSMDERHGNRLEESFVESVNNADENLGCADQQSPALLTLSMKQELSESDMKSTNSLTNGSNCRAEGGPARDANKKRGNHDVRNENDAKKERFELSLLENLYSAVKIEVHDDNESFSAEEFFVGRMESVLHKVSLAILFE